MKNNRKNIFIIGCLTLTLVLFVGCSSGKTLKTEDKTTSESTQGNENERIKITASFYPLAEFARQVGGELVTVENLIPAGVEPHDFEPTPQDVVKINNSKLFILNGAGLDPWAEKITAELNGENTQTLNITKNFALLPSTTAEEDQHNEEETEHEEEHSAFDPHLWLDPVNALREVDVIRDQLIAIDPKNETTYKNNAKAYQQRLTTLDNKFEQALKNCKTREIFTSHQAFAYLAQRYNLTQVGITGLAPEQEPSAKRMAEVSKLGKEKNIKYIFFETLVNPKIAETVASEIGAKTLVLNPLEGLTPDQEKQGEDYITIMETNLKSLQQALECE